MSIPATNGMAMSGVRLNPRLLSIGASPPDCGVQAEPAHGPDAAIHRLWLPRIYQERDYRKASSAHFYSDALSLGVVRSTGFLLGVPQYALVSVRVLAVAQDFMSRLPLHSGPR